MSIFLLSEQTLGYQTSNDPANSDKSLLITGSQNTLIDYQKKVKSRGGYTRLGVANAALTEIRNGWRWNTSNGIEVRLRQYDDQLEAYLTTVDETVINAWTKVSGGWSTTNKLRHATWFDPTEVFDLQIIVQGDANLYEFNGAFAVVASATMNTITKAGTRTFKQNRFYDTRNLVLVCVRTGNTYTYSGGVTTLTLTGTSDATDLVAGDILVQQIVTTSNKPIANYTNDFIFWYKNSIVISSVNDERVYISKTTAYADFAFSTPRLTTEGAILYLDDPSTAINVLGSFLILFAGKSSIYKVSYESVAVGAITAERVVTVKLTTGVNQGALNHECVIPIGNTLAYLSNEVALRIITDPNNLTGIDPATYSNPIKPDFDAEDWTGAFGEWYKNILFFSAPATSHVYMLNFVEDADGTTRRFWNPPQILPVEAFSIYDLDDNRGPLLYGHSNSVPETYLLFDGLSDGQYDGMDVLDKLPIDARAVFAYDDTILVRTRQVKFRSKLKNIDEYWVDGEIVPSVNDLKLDLNYDFGGSTQQIERTIDGTDDSILQGLVEFNSLGQNSLGQNPMGGLLNPPTNARKFHVVFELAKEDYYLINASFSTNEIDRYWAITSHGGNTQLSGKRDPGIRK